MVNYRPEGASPSGRTETKGSGPIGLSDPDRAVLKQGFTLDSEPDSDAERDAQLGALLAGAASDAAAAGWEMETRGQTAVSVCVAASATLLLFRVLVADNNERHLTASNSATDYQLLQRVEESSR
ncbi:MAG: hypothetical protein R2706_03485 [Acidimicrobiales bacterium]